MKTLWGLLFWGIMIFLAVNSLILMKDEHPGYAAGLATLALLSFTAFAFGDFKK
jgi:hypothetical protein